MKTERDEIETRLLERECQISAALRERPHAVTTLDVVRDIDDDPWIVMDYYPSQTLRAVLDREGRLTLAETAAIGTFVLEALRAAHAAGSVHRDVTPANILLGTDGSARLTDFGAAVRRTDQRVTAGVLGVPGFAAPPEGTGRRSPTHPPPTHEPPLGPRPASATPSDVTERDSRTGRGL
nr:protein kinase [Candidatus Frankia alpina]